MMNEKLNLLQLYCWKIVFIHYQGQTLILGGEGETSEKIDSTEKQRHPSYGNLYHLI